MRVVLVGAGVVGHQLAEQLSEERQDISIVDSDQELIRSLDSRFDLLAICGDAASPSILKRAGADEADLVIAVTDSDTTNIVVSLVAKKLGAKKTIVRVRSKELTDPDCVLALEDFGAEVLINPIETTAELLQRLIRNPGATDVHEFADGELLLWGFVVCPDSKLVGIKLKDLRAHVTEVRALVVAIARADGDLVIPSGEDEIVAGDNLYVFIPRKAAGDFRKLISPSEGPVERVLISGASRWALEVAERIESRVKTVILVESDPLLADQASKRLSKTLVIQGDLNDPMLGREYRFDSLDYFLALDDDDQTNLVNGLFIKKQGAKHIAVLAQHPQYLPILNSLNLGVVVTPRLLMVSSILKHIRRGRILQVSRIGESGAEAREYEITEKSVLAGKALKELSLPKGVLVGAVFRNDGFKIPTGDTVVEEGDHVVIFALPEAMDLVEKLFSKKRLFS